MPAPIFVVGVVRSGTTLFAAMLCSHSRLSCGAETKLFTKLPDDVRARILDPATWPDAAVDHWYDEPEDVRPVPDRYGLSRDRVRSFLATRSPSLRAVLESMTELYMRETGKQRWVEKTPDHLFYVDTLRRLYPEAPILRIVRDPRDVALSMLKVPFGADSYLDGLCYWRRRDDYCRRFFDTDPRALTVIYEDVVAEPEATLRRVCEFIGESFEPAMITREGAAQHVNKTGLDWKAGAAAPLDRTRLRGWSRTLSVEQQAQAECLLGDRLRHYGYPHAEEPAERYVAVRPAETLSAFPRAFEALGASGARTWPRHPGERPERTVYLGDPDDAGLAGNWFGTASDPRFARSLRIAGALVRDRILLRRIEWLVDELRPRPTRCGALARTTMKMLRIPRRIRLTAGERASLARR